MFQLSFAILRIKKLYFDNVYLKSAFFIKIKKI